jgi:hypothetical protein
MRTRVSTLGLSMACGFALLAAARGPAADSTARASDPETRARLQRNLAAFHRLSPAMQARVRQLDRTLFDEDAITRQRLFGVMHRYAGWLARAGDDDRTAINDAPAGPARLQLVRSTLDRQWIAGLSKAQRDELANRPTEQAALIEKWKAEDRDRRTARADSLREAEFGPPIERAFREDVLKWVHESLEPKLNKREKDRLTEAYHYPWVGWFQQVAVLSNKHGMKPPGPPEFWKRVGERAKPRFPMTPE